MKNKTCDLCLLYKQWNITKNNTMSLNDLSFQNLKIKKDLYDASMQRLHTEELKQFIKYNKTMLDENHN